MANGNSTTKPRSIQYREVLSLPDGVQLVITDTLLQSELRCIATATKLMSYGYYRVITDHSHLRPTVSRIDKDNWYQNLSDYQKEIISPRMLAHIYREKLSRDVLFLPVEIAQHICKSKDIPGRYAWYLPEA